MAYKDVLLEKIQALKETQAKKILIFIAGMEAEQYINNDGKKDNKSVKNSSSFI